MNILRTRKRRLLLDLLLKRELLMSLVSIMGYLFLSILILWKKKEFIHHLLLFGLNILLNKQGKVDGALLLNILMLLLSLTFNFLLILPPTILPLKFGTL